MVRKLDTSKKITEEEMKKIAKKFNKILSPEDKKAYKKMQKQYQNMMEIYNDSPIVTYISELQKQFDYSPIAQAILESQKTNIDINYDHSLINLEQIINKGSVKGSEPITKEQGDEIIKLLKDIVFNINPFPYNFEE